MNLLGRLFLNFRKDGVFIVRCRRTYVLNNNNSYPFLYLYLYNFALKLLNSLKVNIIIYHRRVKKIVTLARTAFN